MYPHMGNQKLYKVVNSMRLECHNRWGLGPSQFATTYVLISEHLTIDVPGCCLSQHYPVNVARYLSAPTYLLTVRPPLLINC